MYWIVVKLVLTLIATTILLLHMPTVSGMAGMVRQQAWTAAAMGPLRTQFLVHAVGGLVVLLTVTVLSVYKPWGRTLYGRSALEKRERRVVGKNSDAEGTGRSASAWRLYVLLGIIVLVVIAIVRHLIGGLPRH